jgi:hypothetical protein
VAFVGQLGTADSELANIELGTAGSPSRTVQTISAKANLFGKTTQTLQAKASILGVNSHTVQARARIPSWAAFVHDSFNRSDSTSLGNADSGQTWQYDGALTYAVLSNQAQCTNGSAGGGAWIDSGLKGSVSLPIQVAVDVINAGAGNETGVFLRSDGLATGSNRLFVFLQKNAGVYQILGVIFNGGSGFTFYQQPVVGVTVGDNETHRLKVNDDGARLRIFFDDVFQTELVVGAFNVPHATETVQGMFISTSGSADRLDNYQLSSLQTLQTISAKASITKITRTIQAKANLFNTSMQTVQAKASLHASVQNVTLQAKARIQISSSQTLQAKARIQPTHAGEISARAKIAGTSAQTLQAKAQIQVTTTQTISAKANLLMPRVTIQAKAAILNSHLPTIQAKAAITPQTLQKVSARASLLPGPRLISAKARLRNFVTSALEVDYNIQVPVTAGLLVTYNATLSTETVQSLQAKANIKRGVTSNLSVSFDVCYSMPAPPIIRPTQRSEFRTIRTVTAKARIRTCSVVLVGNVYQTICT